MLRNLFLITIIAVSVFSSCRTESVLDLSEEHKEKIIQEIEEAWQISGKGIENLDAEQVFSVFSTLNETKYIRNGHLFPDIETAKDLYAEWFNSPNAYRQKITCDPIIYDVLDDKTAIMTTIGSIVRIGDTISSQQPWVLAYTIVWRKEESGWKIFHMHNSWE